MPSIDENVVSMQFDNKSFEKNIADTISSLDKLRHSLEISNASKTFSDISASSRGVDLSHISGALDTISGKFSAFGAIAFSVLNTLTTKVITAGEQLLKSLSLDQVLSGYREYETNLNSIQTILSNTRADATTLDDVNKALDTLNEYSDKTIYNFSQMARNIGTFTAAGVNLDVSVNAIKGIANLAAVSGSNAEQASSAMYQLSQALASGSLKLMDWNSVVNAGMGGEVFQKALFETGKVLGTIKDTPIDTTFEQWTSAGNTFRGSLEKGWITADVLTQTLSGFTGDMTEAQLKAIGFNDIQIAQILDMGKVAQDAATKVKTFTQLIGTVKESIGSGWASTFRIILGTFDEAKETFTSFNDSIGAVVQKSADARNALLQGWKDMGGRTVLIDTIVLAFTALSKIMSVIKAAFHDVFPKVTSTNLYNLSLALYGLIHNLLLSRETLWKIRRALSGFFSLIAIGFEIITEFGKLIFGVFDNFSGGGKLLDFFADLGIKLTSLKKQLVDEGGIADFFDNLAVKIDQFIGFVSPILGDIYDTIAGFVGKVVEVLGITNSDDTANIFEAITTMFKDLKGSIENFFPQGIADRVTQRVDQVSGGFDILRNVLEKLWEIAKKVGEFVGKVASKIADAFSGLPQAIADAFSNVQYDQALDTINTGFFAGLVLLVRKFLKNPFKLSEGVMKGVNQALGALTGQLKAMQTDLKASALLKIAGAIALLTASLVVLSLMNSAALTKAIVAMSATFGVLFAAMALMDKVFTPTAAGKLAVLATTMTLLSVSMLLLAAAMKIFASMSWEEMGKGFAGVAGSLLIMAKGMELMPNPISLGAKASSLILLAVALNILAVAMKIFATLSWEEIGKGLVSMAGGLLIMARAMKMMPGGAKLALQSVGIIGIAVAMNILATAMKIFATLSWEEIAKGITAIAGALLVIAGAMHLMPDGPQLALQSVGLLAIGASLVAIATAMKIMATLSWEEIVRGLTGIAGALLIMAGISHIMAGNVLGAVAIGIMAASLIILAIAVKQMAQLKWSELGKGLAIMAISLGALAAAALLMQPVLPALFALAIALGVLGVAMALFGAGAFLIASAFAILATSGTQGVATLLGALTVLGQALPGIVAGLAEGLIKSLEMFLDALPGMIPDLSKTIAAIIQLVRDNIPGFIAAFVEFIEGALSAVRDLIPDVVETGFAILTGFLQGISDNIELITQQVVDIIVKFLTTLTANMPDIVAAGLGLLVAFLGGITDNLDEVVGAIGDLIARFIFEISQNVAKVVGAVLQFFIDVMNDLATLIRAKDNQLAAAIANLISAIIGAIVTAVVMVPAILIKNLVTALGGFFQKVIGDLPAKILSNLVWFVEQVFLKIYDLIVGAPKWLLDKITDALGDIWDTIWENTLGRFTGCPAKRSIKKLSELFMWQLVDGYSDEANAASNAMITTTEAIIARVANVSSKIAEALEMNLDMSPTITPVLDLTKISQGASDLNNMLASTSKLSSDLSYSQAAAIATSSTSAINPGESQIAPGVKEVTFTQINNSPESLTTTDIYRNTRNIITLAKEELSVL